MLSLTLARRRALTPAITEFILRPAEGGGLPAVAPGAHVCLTTPSGAERAYSIVNADAAADAYVSDLAARDPGNGFALTEAPEHLLIAGGIGITPILPMARHLAATGRPFRLIYCTRAPEETAYLAEVAALGPAATLHHDGGDPARAFDFWELFAEPTRAHVFCCGPAGLMEEVRAVSGHWSEGAVHFEDFAPDAPHPEDRPFTAVLARSGRRVEVGARQTLLDALAAAGVALPASCRAGVCGTCRCGLVAGEAEHRDRVLTQAERAGQIMPCVSRARGGELVLDL
ncbi:MAG: oxidoreductase [Alphaproteobacteria bacterium HGW-Alphaproteobacteria-2]|nr:MAG: oxidoreductase [Alphaproteobacteria bacterium HGW-Alphaproteobacteria-2]